jgi:hypothetical protein
MQDSTNANVATLENQLMERFGLLMSQTQLAELLGRSIGGLRYSLSYPSDASTRALKTCGRTVGYARFLRLRDRNGRIRGGIYIIREVADSPDPELPDTGLPQTAVPGSANPGALPTTDLNLRRTTTTTPTTTKERSSSENEYHTVEFAWWIPDELQDGAQAIVAELDPAEGQIVIDEWAGCMAAESIDISPLGYLQAMVRRYRDGNFALAFAKDVADMRAKPPADEKGIVEIEICEVDSVKD